MCMYIHIIHFTGVLWQNFEDMYIFFKSLVEKYNIISNTLTQVFIYFQDKAHSSLLGVKLNKVRQ